MSKKTPKKKPKQNNSNTAPEASLPPIQSMESVLSSIAGGMTGRKPSAVDKAQEIMYDAWEAPTRQRAVALANKALEISADCADAYILLAEETAESLEELIELYQKAVKAGERAIGRRAFKEDAGHFWGLLETRPYMRARANLAQILWGAGQYEEAVEHYWGLLRLNPNDNQGIRDLLMPCLIELGHDKDAEKLFNQFKEDGMAFWNYSRALLDFRKRGDSPVAGKSLKAAINKNKHVPSYLLGRKKIPRALPGHYGLGDDNEAVLYAHENIAAWEATPGALEWLATLVK